MNCAGPIVPEAARIKGVNGFTLEPLGDQAVLIRHQNCEAIPAATKVLKEWSAPWKGEIVPSYQAIAVLINTDWIPMAEAISLVAQQLNQVTLETQSPGKLWEVPCCYEMGPDLESAAQSLGITTPELIGLHTGIDFTIYAIGFQPGFPYAGWLPEKLQGLPRLASPRTRVEPGSVGITGKQTGIYPAASPGGWNLIGRTPCPLVDLEKGWFAFAPGDRIRFVAISPTDWKRLEGKAPREIAVN